MLDRSIQRHGQPSRVMQHLKVFPSVLPVQAQTASPAAVWAELVLVRLVLAEKLPILKPAPQRQRRFASFFGLGLSAAPHAGPLSRPRGVLADHSHDFLKPYGSLCAQFFLSFAVCEQGQVCLNLSNAER